MKPVVAIYSTFIQRAVDQFIHDIALQHLHVVIALDRAGAVPDDGDTHQGLYDIALFRPVPGVSIRCPASVAEMNLMLSWALAEDGPVILRYPKAACPTELPAFSLPLEAGRGVFTHKDGSDTLLVCTGGIYPEVHEASNILARAGAPVDSYLVRFIKPLDERFFLGSVSRYKHIVFVEDGIETGGIGEYLSNLVRRSLPGIAVSVLAFGDLFYAQGTRTEILASAGMSPAHIADEVRNMRARTLSGAFR